MYRYGNNNPATLKTLNFYRPVSLLVPAPRRNNHKRVISFIFSFYR